MADGILKWANKVCRGHDHILPPNDYEESWADGLCFCALFYAYYPDKIPIKTLNANSESDMIKNLTLAFEVGKDAGIDPLLDPDDTLHVHEKKSIMLYLSEVYSVLRDSPLKYYPTAEWNKKYESDEKARKFADWKAQKEAETRGEIYTPKTYPGGSVKKGASSAAAPASKPVEKSPEKPPEKTPEKTESQSALPTRNSVTKRWETKTTEDKTPVKVTSPEPVATPSTASEAGLTYEIGGRGKEGGGEGRMLIFSVNFKIDGVPTGNPVKEDIGVHCECPGTVPRFTVMVSNNAYQIGFTPAVGGQYWFDFTYKGNWVNEPFCLAVKNKANKVPDHPYTGAARGGVPKSASTVSAKPPPETASKPEPSKVATPPIKKTPVQEKEIEPCPSNSACFERTAELTEDDIGSFNISCKSNTGDVLKGDYKFDVKFDGPAHVNHKLINNDDGTYKCTFGPAAYGEYRVEVSYKGKLIDKGAWDIKIAEALSNLKVEELTIMVQVTDKQGNPKNSGGETHKIKVLVSSGGSNIEIEDHDDGRYTIVYPVNPGLNSIDVQYDGESLSGFPLTFELPN